MQIVTVTLFPQMVETVVEYGVVGRAAKNGMLSLKCLNPRDFTTDVHRTVDDRPYGGGPGMVMKYEPLASALRCARGQVPAGSPVVCLSPQGRAFDQQAARRFANMDGLILLSGRYEGIDERLLEAEVDEELSLGDFVLSGGEIPAMAVIDAVARLIPGVLGDDESAQRDSFMDGLLDHPHYTRPEEVDGRRVPEVLLSGDHRRIAEWRLKQALGRSYLRRPDLLDRLSLTNPQRRLLEEFLQERDDGL
ncbi:MAG: tRNA (guanosine(37)-N1)-methyltransferase TrmD [Gammaproteobacteria bacterium]|nr:tRNA (guanosine(37)-N1)-methyltransferase TrmD [Gammaproteobacteria bacterium]MDH4254439.1 tRNA (guanosine(37)-N1)-methyltransferase TrmD [Gammaproteobacteria bacterium]MDH5309394.1 tRNA (guanosine(37)-N1)-methyltransferase TrmD [Gammaproteobacteria bacterium]